MKSLIWIASILAAALAAFGVYWFVIRKPAIQTETINSNVSDNGLPLETPTVIGGKTHDTNGAIVLLNPKLKTSTGKILYYKSVTTDTLGGGNTVVKYYDQGKNLVNLKGFEFLNLTPA